MVFSSLVFLFYFLPATLVLYYLFKNKTYRNVLLTITSLFFYAWGEPLWVCLLLFSSLFDWVNALLVEKYRGRWQSKAALVLSAVGNLSILGFFKYIDFFIDNLNLLPGIHFQHFNFGLPIGISFYTFQTLSYVFDVYRGEVAAQKSPLKLLLFVSLFHQLVAGPIVRYVDIANEIDNRQECLKDFSQGVNRFVVGLAKKVLIANFAGEASELFLGASTAELASLGAWYGIALFAFQIYFDFSGYSDMAIGLGKIFGFTYRENFDHPYIAKSATEFWRRWHISLGSFFRDYVYIPLGGNRRYHVRNLLVVWLLTGLWHGASWNFVLWGVYYGLFILLEKLLLLKVLDRVPGFVSHVYLLAVVLVGWVFFYFEDMGKGMSYLQAMFGLHGGRLMDDQALINIANSAFLFVMAAFLCTPLPKLVYSRIRAASDWSNQGWLQGLRLVALPVYIFILFLISSAMLVGQSYNPFLYFRF